MKYTKPLVISDNVYLCKKFTEIITELELSIFEFSISPYSDIQEFKNQLGNIQVYNLKKSSDTAQIIKNYDLVISMHCKQIFPAQLLKAVKCINVHPGYNPVNRGWYPQVFAIANNLQVGATIHEMDEQLDHGNIIIRELVKKEMYDTSLTLYNKIIHKELELLRLMLPKILADEYHTFEPENEGNLFLKKDFEQLKEIKLDEPTTALQVINQLRATTHGAFKNAYFINPETGKKVFVSINLEHEA